MFLGRSDSWHLEDRVPLNAICLEFCCTRHQQGPPPPLPTSSLRAPALYVSSHFHSLALALSPPWSLCLFQGNLSHLQVLG